MKRRLTHLTGTAVCFAALVAIAPAVQAAYPPDGSGSASKPNVNMTRALLAAQIDPGRPGTGITRGAKKSVLRIERALRKKGLLRKKWIDGHFGSSTVAAYKRWQQRIGYSGIGANGIPGKASLRKLGKGRFDVKHVVVPGRKITLPRGSTVNRRTNRMKMAAARRLKGDCKWTVTQGSYTSGVSDSAGTHDGGGAVDLSVNRGCGTRRTPVRALRKVGFAAWRRGPKDGMDPHIHAIAVNDPDLSGIDAGFCAQQQVSEYYRGLDGLGGGGSDDGPKVKKVTWEQYRRN